ncbi:macro domain-containing protein [Clostridium sporogenes]|uniref:macro domain-containing protein n=1 Tax=Clostridium sporogenes TaxID=1509 RepID=UPI0013CB495D|nr:macro domain-containing protein [Clostridium sporogenes]NFF62393.1 macro domain-containing protein [Clostridium sporogenes]
MAISYINKIKIIKGDITKENVDAIVNAANSSLLGGGGVDGAIHRAGGNKILQECKIIVSKIGSLNTGEVVITSGGNLNAKYVIHQECKIIVSKIGSLNTGEVVITSGGNLNAKYVIHTVGPIWHGGKSNEETLLANAYKNSLKLASEKNVKTVAFPNISTGVYRYPKDEAAKVAYNSAKESLIKYENIEEVRFVCFDDYNYKLYKDLLLDDIK